MLTRDLPANIGQSSCLNADMGYYVSTEGQSSQEVNRMIFTLIQLVVLICHNVNKSYNNYSRSNFDR